MQPYFKAKNVFTSQIKQLFKFRTRMSNVKSNFKTKYSKVGYLCPLIGCGKFEDDNHLLKCAKTEKYRDNIINLQFEKLFSGNSKEQGTLIDYLVKAENIRDSLVGNIIPNTNTTN